MKGGIARNAGVVFVLRWSFTTIPSSDPNCFCYTSPHGLARLPPPVAIGSDFWAACWNVRGVCVMPSFRIDPRRSPPRPPFYLATPPGACGRQI